MDWRWLIGISITVGIATAGGIWALVKVVAAVAARAATLETQLGILMPVVQRMPGVEADVKVHERRLNDHDDEIDKLRTKVSQ